HFIGSSERRENVEGAILDVADLANAREAKVNSSPKRIESPEDEPTDQSGHTTDTSARISTNT
ncbi:hypothetical protein McanCB21832_002389, partial [Microsporum canis]